MAKSPSNSSWQSYELFVGQEKGNDDNNKERISIQSDGGDSLSEQRSRLNASKARKISSVSKLCFLLKLNGERSLTAYFFRAKILFRPHVASYSIPFTLLRSLLLLSNKQTSRKLVFVKKIQRISLNTTWYYVTRIDYDNFVTIRYS